MSSISTRGREPIPPAPLRRCELKIVHSADVGAVGKVLPMSGASYVIGREVEGGVRIADDQMSRKHAHVRPTGGSTYVIDDLGSSNGTYVDGRRVDSSVELKPGAVILLGATLLVVDQAPFPDLLPARDDAPSRGANSLRGASLTARRLHQSLATIAPGMDPVLLLGPSGSGKEIAARVLHELSGRSGELVAVNCAAIPAGLAEDELFGHVRGAFNGAADARDGRFVRASGGTLLLDEVGDLAPELQTKLLRALEEGIVFPVGSDEPRSVDVRFVAATSRNLEDTSFREDLRARLSGWVLHLPALRDRRADILELFAHFLPDAQLTERAAEALLLHAWPSNIRELRQVARQVARLSGRDAIDVSVLPEHLRALLGPRDGRARPKAGSVEDTLEQEAARPSLEQLRQELIRCKGNVTQIARERGWWRNSVNRWLKDYDLNPNHYR